MKRRKHQEKARKRVFCKKNHAVLSVNFEEIFSAMGSGWGEKIDQKHKFYLFLESFAAIAMWVSKNKSLYTVYIECEVGKWFINKLPIDFLLCEKTNQFQNR